MKRKFLLVSIILYIACIFTGCSEQQQLHQKLIVQGISVDKENETYKATIQALDFQNPASEDEPNIKIIEVQGQSIMEALDNISRKTSLRPVYSQNLILLLGEETAKSGVNDFIDFFVRHCETRPKVKIAVCKGNASEILKIKSNEKSIKSKNIHDLIPMELNSDVLHFVSNLKNTKSDPWAAWLEIEEKDGNKEVNLKGVGVFSEDKLVDFWQDEDAFGFMVLKGVPEFGSCIINADNCGEVTCIINSSKPKTDVKIQENRLPKFGINLDINASTFSLDKNFYTHEFEDISQVIENKLSEKIGDICKNTMKKSLNMRIDVFEFSKILRNSYPRYFKKYEEKWTSILKRLEYEIIQNVKLKVTGKEPV